MIRARTCKLFEEAASAAVGSPRLASLPPVMLARDGSPILLYRGTQTGSLPRSVRASLSFSASPAVAAVWSAVPPESWFGFASGDPSLATSSTVHAAYLELRRPIVWDENHVGVGEVLRLLRYGEVGGIAHGEALKIYNYLINRESGKARGGEFRYEVLDEDGDPAEDGLDLSGRSRLRDARDSFDAWSDLDYADRLVADAYVFADAPAFVRAALSLGYDGVVHDDPFEAGPPAAESLLGRRLTPRDGVERRRDVSGEMVPCHTTWRAFSASSVVEVASAPTLDLLRAGCLA